MIKLSWCSVISYITHKARQKTTFYWSYYIWSRFNRLIFTVNYLWSFTWWYIYKYWGLSPVAHVFCLVSLRAVDTLIRSNFFKLLYYLFNVTIKKLVNLSDIYKSIILIILISFLNIELFRFNLIVFGMFLN